MLQDLSTHDIIIAVISILVSMGIHEAMHAYTAHWLGDTTAKDMGRLTLNPLKHVDIYTTILLPTILMLFHQPPIFVAKPVPFNPARVKWDEFGSAIIGFAGPLTNFILATIAALILRLGHIYNGQLENILLIFTEVNIGFFIFNMIPIPPLDGSRVLYAFAPEPLQRIMASIESAGLFVILFLLIVLLPVISPAITYLNNHILQFLLG